MVSLDKGFTVILIKMMLMIMIMMMMMMIIRVEVGRPPGMLLEVLKVQ